MWADLRLLLSLFPIGLHSRQTASHVLDHPSLSSWLQTKGIVIASCWLMSRATLDDRITAYNPFVVSPSLAQLKAEHKSGLSLWIRFSFPIRRTSYYTSRIERRLTSSSLNRY